MKKINLLLGLFSLIALISCAKAFICQGAGITWLTSPGLIASCASVQECVPFETTGLNISGSQITMQRCYTSTYPYRTLLNKLMRDDLLVYNTFTTVNGASYNVSFEWDGLVISDDCDTSKTDVLMILIYEGRVGILSEGIANKTYYCEGTICMDSSTGYRYDSLVFTAHSNESTVIFRTLSNKAVRINLRNVVINSTSLPCQSVCGSDPRCNGYMPNASTNKCNLNNTKYYFEDRCNTNCQVVENNSVCRSSIYQPTCNASVLCEGVAPNTCFGSELCYSNCGYYNVNTGQAYCTACGYSWTGTTCCGDASAEYYRTCSLQGGSCTGTACCNATTACVWEGDCYASGSSLTPGSSMCGTTLNCQSGSWTATVNQASCALCGEWVGGSCCYSGNSYNFTGGACINGNVVLCSFDNKCAAAYWINCAEPDPDCSSFNLNTSNEGLTNDFKSISFKLNLFLPEQDDITLSYQLMKGDSLISEQSAAKGILYGQETYDMMISIPETISPGDYKVTVQTTYKGTSYSTSFDISIYNNCIKVDVPARVFIVVENETINDQTFFRVFQNKSFDIRLINNCNETLNDVSTSFMGDDFFTESIILSTTFNSNPVINSMDNETISMLVDYDKGFTRQNITVVKISESEAFVVAESELMKAEALLQHVQLRAPFALLILEQYYADLSTSQELIELARQSFNNSYYDDTLLYASNAITLLEAIEKTLTLPFLLAVTILLTGVATIMFFYTYYKKQPKKKAKK